MNKFKMRSSCFVLLTALLVANAAAEHTEDNKKSVMSISPLHQKKYQIIRMLCSIVKPQLKKWLSCEFYNQEFNDEEIGSSDPEFDLQSEINKIFAIIFAPPFGGYRPYNRHKTPSTKPSTFVSTTSAATAEASGDSASASVEATTAIQTDPTTKTTTPLEPNERPHSKGLAARLIELLRSAMKKRDRSRDDD